MKHQISHTNLSEKKAKEFREIYQSKNKLLEEYISRLIWWNQKINLVSRGVSRETLRQHVEHSLVISGSGLFENASEIIDSGTGGGLPGVPLAIIHPQKRIFLNDVVSKKVMVCKQIASGLNLDNIETVAESVEKIGINSGAVIVSKHAFKINNLLGMIGEKPWGGIILLKGGDEAEAELMGVEAKLDVKIINLEPGFQHPFYKGKAMVEIRKQGTT